MKIAWCENLIFSGGGVKGLLLLGFLIYLDCLLMVERQQRVTQCFQGFAGTSIGAVFALLCSLGIHTSTIIDLFMKHVDTLLVFRAQLPRYLDTSAVCDPIELRRILVNILVQHTGSSDITFRDLARLTQKDLVVCAVNVQSQKSVLFRAKTTPHVRVLDAVLASMAVPFLFPPVKIGDSLYVDGGIMMNLPVHAFGPDAQNLCAWICSKDQDPKVCSPTSTFSSSYYWTEICALWMHAQEDMLHQVLPLLPKCQVVYLCCTSSFLPNPHLNVARKIQQGVCMTSKCIPSQFKTSLDTFFCHFLSQ